MERFDRQTLRILSRDVEDALEELGVKHEVTFRMAGGSFAQDANTAKLKLEITMNNSDLPSQMEQEYHQHMSYYNLPPFGASLHLHGKNYKAVGFKSRNRKYPLIMENTDTGGKFKFPLDVLDHLESI
jgi:hypothetical protein